LLTYANENLSGEEAEDQITDDYDQREKKSNDSCSQKYKRFFHKTRDIKLDKENLLSINNVIKPILIDEKFKFNLNSSRKYVNIFLWTVQYQHKMTKMKNLLVGYVVY
jgi:hypothetical protein